MRLVRQLIERRLTRDMAEEPDTATLIDRLRESDKSWHVVQLRDKPCLFGRGVASPSPALP